MTERVDLTLLNRFVMCAHCTAQRFDEMDEIAVYTKRIDNYKVTGYTTALLCCSRRGGGCMDLERELVGVCWSECVNTTMWNCLRGSATFNISNSKVRFRLEHYPCLLGQYDMTHCAIFTDVLPLH